jgi:acetate---CoA ligase (ADP-forming)
VRGVERLFSARSVAIVGASDRNPQATVVENLRESDCDWILGVHPRRAEVLGVRCHRSFDELPHVPDMAVMLIPDGALAGAVEAGLAAGVGCFVVPGLANGSGRPALVDELAGRVRDAGAVLLGPNCMGLFCSSGPRPWLGTRPAVLRSGGTAVVTQSGAIGEALLDNGGRVGIRSVASVGFEAVCDVADVCAHLAADPGTTVVCLFLETVRRPAELGAALRALDAAGKPVVVLSAGRSAAAARAAAAHTGARPDDDLLAAVAGVPGVIVADDYPDLVEVLALLDGGRRPAGRRTAIVGLSGGEAALLGSLADGAGLPLPQPGPALAAQLRGLGVAGLPDTNPLDAWTVPDTAPVFERALALLACSGEYDVLVAALDHTETCGAMEREAAMMIAGGLVDATRGTPVLPVVLSLQAAGPPPELAALAEREGVPMLRNSGSAVRALAAVTGWWARGRAGRCTTG